MSNINTMSETIKIYATTKYVRMSAQKVRLVADMVRNTNAMYASEMLNFVSKKAALPVRKTIDSAIANAVNNFNLDKKALKVVEIRVDEAPTFKRGRAVSKGRYHQILKRNCHIIVAVSDGSKQNEVKSKVQKPETKVEVTKQTTKKTEKVTAKTKPGQTKVVKKMVKSDQVKQARAQRITQAKGK